MMPVLRSKGKTLLKLGALVLVLTAGFITARSGLLFNNNDTKFAETFPENHKAAANKPLAQLRLRPDKEQDRQATIDSLTRQQKEVDELIRHLEVTVEQLPDEIRGPVRESLMQHIAQIRRLAIPEMDNNP